MEKRNKTDSSRESGTRISVTLTPEQREAVRRIASEMQVSTAWVIRQAVDRYLAGQTPLHAATGPQESQE